MHVNADCSRNSRHSQPPVIRLMTLSDYERVLNLWRNTPGMGLRVLDDSREGIARYLERNPETCFVAETPDQQLIGSILCGHDGRRGLIYHTAVDPTARRLGTGSALVRAATEALRQQGIVKVSLVAFAANDDGNAFWEAQGFTARTDLVYRDRSLVEDNPRL